MTITKISRRLGVCVAAAALSLGFAVAPVSVELSGNTISVKQTEAFARQGRGADDAAGHVRGGKGADDAAGHVRGGGKKRGADDAAGHVRGGGKGRGADDGAGHK